MSHCSLFWQNKCVAVITLGNKWFSEQCLKRLIAYFLTYRYTICFLLFLVISPCRHGNGGCSHLCFIVPYGYRCGCPSGTALREDGFSCQEGLSLSWIFIHKNESLLSNTQLNDCKFSQIP